MRYLVLICSRKDAFPRLNPYPFPLSSCLPLLPSFTCTHHPTWLVFNTNQYVTIQFNPEGNSGYYDDRAELVFEDAALALRFTITRPLRAVVGEAAVLELLKPTAPYVRPKPKDRDPVEEVVDGIPPPALAEVKWAVPLPIAPVPKYIPPALAIGSRAEKTSTVRNTLLPRTLTHETYGRHWKTLLWIEEEQMRYVLFRSESAFAFSSRLTSDPTSSSTIWKTSL